jgi:hypothetical protein
MARYHICPNTLRGLTLLSICTSAASLHRFVNYVLPVVANGLTKVALMVLINPVLNGIPSTEDTNVQVTLVMLHLLMVLNFVAIEFPLNIYESP